MISRRRLVHTALALPLATLPLRSTAQARWGRVADAAREMEQLHSLQIAQAGTEVLAEAFRGPGLNRSANIKSVSPTIVATLTGIAIDRGDLPSITATLGEAAAGLIPAAADPRVADLTMEDLVTMRAGLDRTSGANYGSWVSSTNWVANALTRPFVAEPGGRMLYSTGSFHILGAALAEASGQSLHAQAHDRLARPLGIDIPPWTRDPQGYFLGGNDMAMTPRALLRFGEMIRQVGIWDGRQVVSRDWLAQSFRPRTRSPWSGLSYGYGWFLGGRGEGRFMLARGYGGQVLCVMPGLNLTVAITSDPTRPARSAGYFGDLMALIQGPVMQAALG